MYTLNFCTLCPYIIGTGGRHWPEYGGADRVFMYGYFKAQLVQNGISPQSVQKYLNGSAKFPRKLQQEFTIPGGELLLYANIMHMVSECPCVSHLIEMQYGVYEFICSCDLPHETYLRLVSLYIPDQPTADEIARFLSAVLHAAILAS